MYCAEYSGINSFLVESCKLLLKEGVMRETRGSKCYELPEPYMFKIANPCARLITIPERKWFKVLPYAESLWIASGRNDMEFISHYLPRMDEYSDNHITMRGGYGPRVRHYNGESADYDNRIICSESHFDTDQLRYVVECFKQDINTRRAIITLGDPMKDCFDTDKTLKQTKDIPCTRTLQFIKDCKSDKLNMIVTMRSNDLIYGASAVNVFNYTFMQEYMAAILGLGIGSYFHVVSNMHYYDEFTPLVKKLSLIENLSDEGLPFSKSFHSLAEFDSLLKRLADEEEKMRLLKGQYMPIEWDDEFFDNWYSVLMKWNATH